LSAAGRVITDGGFDGQIKVKTLVLRNPQGVRLQVQQLMLTRDQGPLYLRVFLA